MDRRTFLELASATAMYRTKLWTQTRGIDPNVGPSAVGHWIDDAAGMPAFIYTGPLQFAGTVSETLRSRLPDDPYFLLGNQRLTLFAHASGRLRLLSGERGWARLNGVAGENRSILTVDGVAYPLIGLRIPAAISATKTFSLSASRYSYNLPQGVQVTRTIAVRPSRAVGEGTSAFLITVEIRNDGSAPVKCAFEEALLGDYSPIWPPWSHNARRIRYERTALLDRPREVASVHTKAVPAEPLLFHPGPAMSEFDAEPPAMFITADGALDVFGEGYDIGVRCGFVLKPGDRRTARFVVGYSFDPAPSAMRLMADSLLRHSPGESDPFAAEWAALVPAFSGEPEPDLRREMRWNAGVLEAMATWREYYGESVVPQGTAYDYEWGWLASSRDLAQHALPLCSFNPKLARSVIRYIFKRTLPDGEIKLNDEGFGWSASSPMQTSDQQLYLFMLVAEFLRKTNDTSLLEETVSYYPAENAGSASGLEHLERAFIFLRDRVGTGSHGLLKLWNSDWNDMFYSWKTPLPYNELFETAESHLNSAIALNVLSDLSRELRRIAPTSNHSNVDSFANALDRFRASLLHGFMSDLGDRSFPRRAYLGRAGSVGDTTMWLEPQGFTLSVPELPAARKKLLREELRRRLMRGEAMGPRQIESPDERGDLPSGIRENGGFWYALTGPVVLGLATFDKPAAEALLRKMTLAHHVHQWPQYWTGQWSAADSLDASIVPSEGLSSFPIYCAHPHAWPLFCYLRLRETNSS